MRSVKASVIIALLVSLTFGAWVIGAEGLKKIVKAVGVTAAPAIIELSKEEALKVYEAEVNWAIAQQELRRAHEAIFAAHRVTPDKYVIEVRTGKLIPLPPKVETSGVSPPTKK